MKVVSSLKTLKVRDRNSQIVKRRGRLYVINKRNPRFKARQGCLLYTSPSPRDREKSRMPSSA